MSEEKCEYCGKTLVSKAGEKVCLNKRCKNSELIQEDERENRK